MDTLITVLIVAGAGLWFVFWLRGRAKGTGGCSCGCCDETSQTREEPVEN